MDRITSIQEKQRKSRCRDKYLMKDKFEVIPQKKIKNEKSSSNESKSDIPNPTEFEKKLHSIQATNLPNSDPQKLFDSLKVSDFSYFIGESVQRAECPSCHKKSKIYCSDCLLILHHGEKIPKVKLPFKLTIIHHDSEKIRKSSALPASLLIDEMKENCDVVHFPTSDIPPFDAESTLILYPHKDSRKVMELGLEDLQKVRNVVAIDCTWNQTNSILNKLDNPNYKFVRLEDYNTTFWRYQFHQPNCLATIEAIYYFYKEFDVNFNTQINRIALPHTTQEEKPKSDVIEEEQNKEVSKEKEETIEIKSEKIDAEKGDTLNEYYQYDGKYDNLLFFYAWNYEVIQQHYKYNTSNSFRKIKNYIKYDQDGNEQKPSENAEDDEKE